MRSSVGRLRLCVALASIAAGVFLISAAVVRNQVLPHYDIGPGNSASTAGHSAALHADGNSTGDEDDDNSLKWTLICCAADTFVMGSLPSEKGSNDDERQVSVTITDRFWLGRTEVTQAEWEQIMGTTPWGANDPQKLDYPVTNVSWNDAMTFCRTLTSQERSAGRLSEEMEYTLPTEAQWEYACRAGTTTRFLAGDDVEDLENYAWWGALAAGSAASEPYAHKTSTCVPNWWGLCDMPGNVAEWVLDNYEHDLPGGADPYVSRESPLHVTRGGSWDTDADHCRAASRVAQLATYSSKSLGFRVALCRVRSTLPSANRGSSEADDLAIDVFSMSDGTPIVPVKLEDGETYSFILDTGCSRTFFDVSLADLLGRSVRSEKIVTPASATSTSEYAMPDLTAGHLRPAPGARVFCSDLSAMRQAVGLPIFGLLGMDFLRDQIVQFDFDRGKVRILESLPTLLGTPVPIDLDGPGAIHVPKMSLELGPEGAQTFQIDSGFNGTIGVTPALFGDLDRGGHLGNVSRIRAASLSGISEHPVARLDVLRIGRFVHRDVVLYRFSGANTVGLKYLQRYLVTFDFPRRTMYLNPSQTFDRDEESNLRQ